MNSNQRKTGLRRDGKHANSAAQNPAMAPATSSRQISSVVKSAMQTQPAQAQAEGVHGRIVQRSNRMTALALGHHIARTAFTPAALGGHAQFELDFVKAHARTGVAGDSRSETRRQTQTIMAVHGE